MPSAFAHAAVGASLSCLLPRPARSLPMIAALAVLAAAPDLDVIGFELGIPYGHPLGHRGLSHSLPFAAAIGALCMPLWRRRLGGADATRAARAAGVCFLAVASHGLLDTLTNGGKGVGLLIPLHPERFFAPWRPIQVSPLSLDAFFSRRGLAILETEAVWIGLPCLAFVAAVAGWRRYRTARGRSPDASGTGARFQA